MASIGIIVRADRAAESLPRDWVPEPLGSRSGVLAAIAECVPADDGTLALRLCVEDVSESEGPRSISVSGVWGERESAVLRELCRKLDARFYDSEEAEFIDL